MAKGRVRGSWLPLALCCAALLTVCSVVAETDEPAGSSDTVFYESFDQPFEGRWVTSESGDYKGVWKHELSEGHEDYGLLVSEKAKKHGIAIDLPETVTFKDDVVVLQFDVRLQTGLECGGAYLKYLLPQEAGWTPSQFDNTAPYSIMFGPDKCGSTNKVHFIFRHKSPKTGEYIEHHLKNPPTPVGDKLSHVYTAVIYPNNTVKILVDGEEKKAGDLLSQDFEPAVIPPKTIPDPDDRKPEDWDERAKIPDPDATKPEDWDEDAPREIEDLETEKPEGWLDDEPDEVDDPEAVKPEDWDEDEDGEWEAPKVPNPKCDEAAGCGEWVRPLKKNPDYKGKWSSPLITNPAYKGIWSPRQIDNPDYFELEKPNLEPLAAIGIEIWTMQDGILFDNILITRSEDEAAEYRENTWKPKHDAEKDKQSEEEKPQEASSSITDKIFEVLYQIADIPFLAKYKDQITELVEKAEKHKNLTIVGLLGATLALLVVLQSLLFRKKPVPPVSVAKKEDITTPDDLVAEKTADLSEKVGEPVEGTVDDADASGEIEKDDEPSTTRRRNRRET